MRTYSLEIHIKEVKNLSVGNKQPESSSCLIFTHGLADTEQSGAFTLPCKCQILPEQLQITLTIRVGWLFFVSGHDITLWCMLSLHLIPWFPTHHINPSIRLNRPTSQVRGFFPTSLSTSYSRSPLPLAHITSIPVLTLIHLLNRMTPSKFTISRVTHLLYTLQWLHLALKIKAKVPATTYKAPTIWLLLPLINSAPATQDLLMLLKHVPCIFLTQGLCSWCFLWL